MYRKVYLEGELGEKFGAEHSLFVDNYRDALRCIDSNNPGFRAYLINCQEKNIAFTFESGEETLQDHRELIFSLRNTDIRITPIPAGSKSGIGKILAAIVIAYIVLNNPAMAAQAEAGGTATVATGASLSGPGYMAASMAANLAMTGMAQMMAPDPSVDDSGNPENYLFNGGAQNTAEGDPVPVLYGELRVPGRQISLHATKGRYKNTNAVIDSLGNVYQFDSKSSSETQYSNEDPGAV